MAGTILVDEGDGTFTECHVVYNGTSGPYLIPVGDTFVDADDNTVPVLPLTTSSQISIGTLPSSGTHVIRLEDFTSGSLTELTLGDNDGNPTWRISVDPATKDLKFSVIRPDGVVVRHVMEYLDSTD